MESVAQETALCERCKQQAPRSELIKKGSLRDGITRYRHALGKGCMGPSVKPQVEYTDQAVEYALMPYQGAQIAWERDLQRVCLNDIHKALGGTKEKEPRVFFQLKSTEARIRFLMRKYNISFDDIKGTRTGKGGGSWPVRELGLDYSMWADMRFHDACIDWLLSRGVGPQPTVTVIETKGSADDVLQNPERYTAILMAAKHAEEIKRQVEEQRRQAKLEADRLRREAEERERIVSEETTRLEREANEKLNTAKRAFNGPPQEFYYLRKPIREYDGKCDFKQGQTITIDSRNGYYTTADPQSAYRVVVPASESTKCENVARKIFGAWLVKGTKDHFEGVPIDEYERYAQWLENIKESLTPKSFDDFRPCGAMF